MADDVKPLMGREEFLAAVQDKPRTAVVMCFGKRAKCRAMTSDERDKFDSETIKIEKNTGDRLTRFTARVVAASVCDEEGNLILTPDDVTALGNGDHRSLRRLYKAAADLNGFGEDDNPEPSKNL